MSKQENNDYNLTMSVEVESFAILPSREPFMLMKLDMRINGILRRYN